MQLVEFMEAITRLADKISPGKQLDEKLAPPDQDQSEHDEAETEETWDVRSSRSLEEKLQIFINLMKERLLDNNEQDKFRLKRNTVSNFTQKINALRVVSRLANQIDAFHTMQKDIAYMDQQQKECLEALDY